MTLPMSMFEVRGRRFPFQGVNGVLRFVPGNIRSSKSQSMARPRREWLRSICVNSTCAPGKRRPALFLGGPVRRPRRVDASPALAMAILGLWTAEQAARAWTRRDARRNGVAHASSIASRRERNR